MMDPQQLAALQAQQMQIQMEMASAAQPMQQASAATVAAGGVIPQPAVSIPPQQPPPPAAGAASTRIRSGPGHVVRSRRRHRHRRRRRHYRPNTVGRVSRRRQPAEEYANPAHPRLPRSDRGAHPAGWDERIGQGTSGQSRRVVGGVFAEERPPQEVGFRDSWGDDSFGGRRVIGGRFMIEQYRGHWNAYELSAVEPPVEEISFDEGQEILD